MAASVRRIAVVTPWDIASARSWSGMIAPMVSALTAEFEEVDFIAVPDGVAFSDRLLARIYGLRGSSHLPSWSRPTARRRSSEVARQLAQLPQDIPLVAIAATPELLMVPDDRRIVQITDSSFRGLADSYHAFSRVPSRGRREAERIESMVARRTSSFLVATSWSRQKLIEDVGASPTAVTVAHFGPAILPSSGSPEKPSPRVHQTRLLFIASDWRRKGGDVAVEAVTELRDRGLDVSLTVVGEPGHVLPRHVRVTGRLSPESLSAEYFSHDVLLEPSSASAGGVVVTDAFHHGLPVLASATGGLPDLVADGSTGWLVPPSSTAGFLADTIEKRVLSSDLDAFGDRARRWARASANWSSWALAVRFEVER